LQKNLISEQAEDFVKFESEGRNTHRTPSQEGDRKNLLLNIREQEESEKNAKRYQYANEFIYTARLSMLFVALLLIADGLEDIPFQLSNSVMLGILGTALANVLAPVFLLVKYLFNVRQW